MELLTKSKILGWLREKKESRLSKLWYEAEEVRKKNVGDQVYLRGLVEISNRCVRSCTYCGLWCGNRKLYRYLMPQSEILKCAKKAEKLGYGTIVLQSGEHPSIQVPWLGSVIAQIKRECGLAVTICVGERQLKDYHYWKRDGADRCLLKFETSDKNILRILRPFNDKGLGYDRQTVLPKLRNLGYEIGSGIMVGLPGQTYESIADDIELFAKMDLDMIAVGPYIPNFDTPLGQAFKKIKKNILDQVPNTGLMTLKVIALSRLMCPTANIPATTALATSMPNGFAKGLGSGANVIMPNLTPLQYRLHYDIYPKPYLNDEIESHKAALGAIFHTNRKQGFGRGDRVNLKCNKNFSRNSGDGEIGGTYD